MKPHRASTTSISYCIHSLHKNLLRSYYVLDLRDMKSSKSLHSPNPSRPGGLKEIEYIHQIISLTDPKRRKQATSTEWKFGKQALLEQVLGPVLCHPVKRNLVGRGGFSFLSGGQSFTVLLVHLAVLSPPVRSKHRTWWLKEASQLSKVSKPRKVTSASSSWPTALGPA